MSELNNEIAAYELMRVQTLRARIWANGLLSTMASLLEPTSPLILQPAMPCPGLAAAHISFVKLAPPHLRFRRR